MDRYKRLALVVFFAVALLGAIHISGMREQFDVAYLQQRFSEHMGWGLVIFVALFVLGNLAQIPGWVFLSAAVLTLGEGWGALVTYTAACVSCVVTYGVARLIGGDALRQLRGRWAVWLLGHLDTQPVRSVTLLRLMLQTLPALNYALAMSGVKFRHYLIGTVLGLPVPIVLLSLFVGRAAELLKMLQQG